MTTSPEEPTIGAPAADAPAAEIARDMARRGLFVLPIVVCAAALIGGIEPALSVGYAMVIVMLNFLLSAYLLRWAARISLGLVASVALGGYVMRLALIFLAVWIVRDAPWIRMIPLGIAIIATHLGLLVWELRHVSASFAHPGLKPTSGSPSNWWSGSGKHGVSRPAAGYQPERFRSSRRNNDADSNKSSTNEDSNNNVNELGATTR